MANLLSRRQPDEPISAAMHGVRNALYRDAADRTLEALPPMADGAVIEAGSIPEPNSGCWLWLRAQAGRAVDCRDGRRVMTTFALEITLTCVVAVCVIVAQAWWVLS